MASPFFEGMKAYRAVDGRILMFRPDRNMARLNVSNERLCIPQIDEAFCTEAIAKLVSVGKGLDSPFRGYLPVHPPLYYRH